MSDVIKFSKVVSALPATLESNTIYFVKTGLSALVYVTNDLGLVVATPITVDLSSKADLIHSHDLATITDAGFMSAADKAKLNNSPVFGEADNEVLSNGMLRHLNSIRSSAYVSLDFINDVYKANYSGTGLLQYSLNTIISGSRSDIKLAYDQSNIIDDGMCTYHSNSNIYTALEVTDIPPVATKYAPANYKETGIYQYRGQWGVRTEKRLTADLAGSIAVSQDRYISGGLLIEPKSKNLCTYPPVYTAVNGTIISFYAEWVPLYNLTPAAIALLPPSLNNLVDVDNATELNTFGSITGRRYLQQVTDSAVISGQVYTWSVYVSIDPSTELNSVFLELDNAFPAAAHCSFIVSKVNGKTIFTATGQGAGCIHYSIESLHTAAWQHLNRISITAQANSNNIAHLRVGIGLADNASLSSEDFNSFIVLGEQFENAPYPSSYICPFDSVKSVRGSDLITIPCRPDAGPHVKHDGFSEYKLIRYHDIGAWIVINVDQLLYIDGYEHILTSMSDDSTRYNALKGVLSFTATVQSSSEILFKLKAFSSSPIASNAVLATVDHSRPFSVALRVDYMKDTAMALIHQDDTIVSLSLTAPEFEYIVPQVDFLIGAEPAETGTTSSNNNITMCGHIRNCEVFPMLTSQSDIELIMKNYDC